MMITTRPAGVLAGVLAAALLAACETTEETAATPETTDSATAETTANNTGDATTQGTPDSADEGAGETTVPHIYMALQPGGTGRPVSVVFAIDNSRDGTPSDEEAIRLTPEAGDCNPQEMRSYDFPAEYAERPVVSETEAEKGLSAEDLPRYLAATVTGQMVEEGLASEPEETRPQNVCTRKLWEQLVSNQNRDQAAAGQ